MSKVLIPLAQGCEELEAVTIIDLLVRAGVSVTTASLDNEIITASRGTRILADTHIDKVMLNNYDLIVLPGGLPGANHLRDDLRVQSLLKKQNKQNKLVAAICAAPIALAEAGLLNNKTATAYPGTLAALHKSDINIKNSAIEIDGNIITSRGPGTAMDFALVLIEKLEGEDKRDEILQQLAR